MRETRNNFRHCNKGGLGVQTGLALFVALGFAGMAHSAIIINEVDADTASIDTLEFIELSDGGVGNTVLTDLRLVLYNGGTGASYAAFDLWDYSTNSSGFFLLGNAAVTPYPDIIIPDGVIQNGADAVALYPWEAGDFPYGTPVSSWGLLDALVYGTSDPTDDFLLEVLGETTQYDENGNSAKDTESLQWSGATWLLGSPTPGAANVPEPTTALLLAIGLAGLAGAGRGRPLR